jgi:hypothetical protein
MKIAIIIYFLFLYPALAWEGVDFETNEQVEIGKGNYVAFGQEIEFYDYDTNQYHDAEVYSIAEMQGVSYVEIFDNTLNKKRTLLME